MESQGSDTLVTWGGAGWGQLILSFRKRSEILDIVPRPQHSTAKYTTSSSQVTSTKQSHPQTLNPGSTQRPSKTTDHARAMCSPNPDGQHSLSVERVFHLGPVELRLVESSPTQEWPLRSLMPPATHYSLSPKSGKWPLRSKQAV